MVRSIGLNTSGFEFFFVFLFFEEDLDSLIYIWNVSTKELLFSFPIFN